MRQRRIGWLCWLLCAACLYLFENQWATRVIFFSSLLIPLCSIGCACHAARHTSLSLSAPERLSCREAAETMVGSKADFTRIGCNLQTTLRVENQLTGESTGQAIILNSRGTNKLSLSSEHCGALRVAVADAFTEDWFGLFHFSFPAKAETAVLVHPAIYPVLIEESGDRGGDAGAADADARHVWEPGGNELRGYLPGDPIRQIHWKLSEKVDSLLVRESLAERQEAALLLLELGDTDDADAIHSAAEALFSVSTALMAAGLAHQVAWLDALGECCTAEVLTEEDESAMQKALLAGAARGAMGISEAIRQKDSDSRCRKIIVFSPSPQLDLAALAAGQPVTLVLPPFVSCSGATGRIVQTISPENAEITL